MPTVTGNVSSKFALKPIHVGFHLSQVGRLSEVQPHLSQESMCWSRTTRDGQQNGAGEANAVF